MSTRAILEEYAAKTGWNEDSMLAIVCDYLDNQQADDTFEDFIRQRAEEEDAETEEP